MRRKNVKESWVLAFFGFKNEETKKKLVKIKSHSCNMQQNLKKLNERKKKHYIYAQGIYRIKKVNEERNVILFLDIRTFCLIERLLSS